MSSTNSIGTKRSGSASPTRLMSPGVQVHKTTLTNLAKKSTMGSNASRRTTQKIPLMEENPGIPLLPKKSTVTFGGQNVSNYSDGNNKTGSVMQSTRRTTGFLPHERQGTIPWLVNTLVPSGNTKSEVDEIRTGPCGCNRQRDPGI